MNHDDVFIRERDFSRVDALVPFEFGLVPEEDKLSIRCHISTSPLIISESMPELEDEGLCTWLKILNSKIDTILEYIIFQKEGFLALKMRPLNISGSGMSFTSDQGYNIGDILEVKMMMNSFHPVALYLYGKVVKTEDTGSDPKFNTAIRFIEIDDDITNLIVRFVFEMQRGQLRKRKEIQALS
jgi:hypothetical protein